MLRNFHEAKESAAKAVVLWGSGKVKREFLHSNDAASGMIFAMENYNGDSPLNIGYGQDVSIAELADTVSRVVGFDGNIEWDPSMPDGVPRKLLDSSRINSLGWSPTVELEPGLNETYASG